MIVSDRLLTVLQQHIKINLPALVLPELRDTDAKQIPGETLLILDADEPEEHEGMHGIFIINAEIFLKLHAKDETPDTRREMLGDLEDLVSDKATLKAFVNDPLEPRGIGSDGFHMFDAVIKDGGWATEGDELMGGLLVEVTCMGLDKT